MNEQNLKPATSRTASARRDLARKAGKASGRKRREMKAARDAARELLALPLDESEETQRAAAEWLSRQGIRPKEQSQMLVVLLAVQRRAQRGDIRAAETLLKIAGEWPAEKSEVTTTENGAPIRYDFSGFSVEEMHQLARDWIKAKQEAAAG